MSLVGRARRGLRAYLAGGVGRRTLVAGALPGLFVSYFGGLGLAIALFPGHYDWRSETASKLFDPSDNPDQWWIGAAGVALAGCCIMPFGGYIGRRLRKAAPIGSRIGAVFLGAGAIGAFLSGLVAYRADFLVPHLHTMLARGTAFAFAVGMIAFWVCALRGWRLPEPGGARQRALAVVWSALVLVGPAAAVLSARAADHLIRGEPGLWEWMASAVLFLFLASSAWLLPE